MTQGHVSVICALIDVTRELDQIRARHKLPSETVEALYQAESHLYEQIVELDDRVMEMGWHNYLRAIGGRS